MGSQSKGESNNLNGYSFEDLTTPFVRRIREKLQKETDRIIRVLKDASNARTVKDFAHEGKVKSRRTYVDHRTRLAAVDKMAELMGAKINKHEVEHSDMEITVVVKRYSEDAEGGG